MASDAFTISCEAASTSTTTTTFLASVATTAATPPGADLGLIVGASVGGGMLLVGIGALVYFLRKKKKPAPDVPLSSTYGSVPAAPYEDVGVVRQPLA